MWVNTQQTANKASNVKFTYRVFREEYTSQSVGDTFKNKKTGYTKFELSLSIYACFVFSENPFYSKNTDCRTQINFTLTSLKHEQEYILKKIKIHTFNYYKMADG